MVVFNYSGVFNIPAGVSRIKVTVVGGGGSVSQNTYNTSNASAGATAISVIDVKNGGQALITVGTGAPYVYASNGQGGDSIFYYNGVNVIGGGGGTNCCSTASGGQLNMNGFSNTKISYSSSPTPSFPPESE